MSSTFTVERRATVAAPPGAVLDRVADLHRWPAWSPWEDLDPAMDRSYSGSEAGVGAVYEWDGNRRAGKGRMEVTESDDQHVTIDLRMERPWPASNTATFRVVPAGEGCEVTWTMSGPQNLAMRLMSIVRPMDKMVGPDFEKGLARLKADAEAS